MGKRQSIPRWRIVLPVLMIMLAVISMLFVSIPMAIPMRLSVLAGMMAFASALFAGLGVAVLVHRRYMGMLSMAAGVALIGKWLWQMGQAWNLPRLERRSVDTTTLPVFGMLCLVVGIVGIVLSSVHTLEMERLRKAVLQAA